MYLTIRSRHRWLSLGKNFSEYFIKKNFKRVFLETTFFQLVRTITPKPLDRSFCKSNHLFYTWIVFVWTSIKLKFWFLINSFLQKTVKKRRFFKKKFCNIPPYCYLLKNISFIGSYDSHSHTEYKTIWFFVSGEPLLRNPAYYQSIYFSRSCVHVQFLYIKIE